MTDWEVFRPRLSKVMTDAAQNADVVRRALAEQSPRTGKPFAVLALAKYGPVYGIVVGYNRPGEVYQVIATPIDGADEYADYFHEFAPAVSSAHFLPVIVEPTGPVKIRVSYSEDPDAAGPEGFWDFEVDLEHTIL